MSGTSQRSRVKAASAAVVAGNTARQTAAKSIAALHVLNEKDSLAALKTAVTALGTALLSDPR